MESFIIIIIVIVCVLLGIIILIQNPKGGGLAVGFQGASQMGGVQQTTDFLEKATRYLAGALLVLCMFSAYVYDKEDLTPVIPTEETAPTPEAGGGEQAPANESGEDGQQTPE